MRGWHPRSDALTANAHLTDLRHAADALAGTEDPDGALMVTWCEARSIIDDNWAALIRIARALQIQRRMDGATIDVVWDCCQREKRAIGKAGA